MYKTSFEVIYWKQALAKEADLLFLRYFIFWLFRFDDENKYEVVNHKTGCQTDSSSDMVHQKEGNKHDRPCRRLYFQFLR